MARSRFAPPERRSGIERREAVKTPPEAPMRRSATRVDRRAPDPIQALRSELSRERTHVLQGRDENFEALVTKLDAPRKPGRPPLGDRKRGHRAYLRFTEAEWLAVEHAAHLYGYEDCAGFAHDILMHAIKSL